jgi:hypothetical protein
VRRDGTTIWSRTTSLDAEQQLLSPVALAQFLPLLACLVACHHLTETFHVDADRVTTDADQAVVPDNAVRLRLEPQHAQARELEVAGVVAGMEPNVVGSEDAA